jgi:hypothetical protein
MTDTEGAAIDLTDVGGVDDCSEEIGADPGAALDLCDPACRQALGRGLNAVREAEGEFAKLSALRDAGEALEPFNEQDAIDHLHDMAVDVYGLKPDLVTGAIGQGMRRASERRAGEHKGGARHANGQKRHEAKQDEAPTSLDEWDAGEDTAPIPPRRWLLGNQFCREFVSSIVAPGGTGKSALRLAQYLSMAIGRSLTGQHVFHRARVLVLSLEDDRDEFRRRIQAALIHHEISRDELKGWFYCATPKGLKLAEMRNGSRQAGALEKLLREAIERRRPEIVALDPFIKTHGLEENENTAMDYVCDRLATLAIEYGIAVDIPHHTKKGHTEAGDADAGRGASSTRDAARLVCTLTTMKEDEAEAFDIPAAERRSYVRLDSAKVNIARHDLKADWFKLVGVRLDNSTAEYPNGDEVQTVVPWKPPETWANLSDVALNAALSEIDAGMPNGQRYSGAASAKSRAAWPVVRRHCPNKTEAQCREIVRKWLKTGVLYDKDYDDPKTRKTVQGLCVNPAKRPGSEVAP